MKDLRTVQEGLCSHADIPGDAGWPDKPGEILPCVEVSVDKRDMHRSLMGLFELFYLSASMTLVTLEGVLRKCRAEHLEIGLRLLVCGSKHEWSCLCMTPHVLI